MRSSSLSSSGRPPEPAASSRSSISFSIASPMMAFRVAGRQGPARPKDVQSLNVSSAGRLVEGSEGGLSVRDSELPEDGGGVTADRYPGDGQARRDRGGGESLIHQLQHLTLAL